MFHNDTANPGDRRFANNVVLLASGTVASQVISLLSAPLTARLFPSHAFGVAAVFAALVGLVLPVVCLRYESAILIPEKDDEAINALGLSLSVVVLITGLSAVTLFALRDLISRSFHAPELAHYIWLAPISILAGGTFLSLTMWNIRKKKFGYLTYAQIVNAASAATLQVFAGLTGHLHAGWLIGPIVTGSVISTLVLFVPTWRDSAELIKKQLHLSGMAHALRRYQRFPRFSSISTVMNGISWQLPPFFLSSFFTQDVVGQFALGNRIVRAPMNLIGGSIAKVFAQRAAEAKHSNTLAQTAERVFRHLVSLTLFPCMLLCVMGKDLFIVLFSVKWAEAGVYSQILSAWVCIWFISSPLSMVFVVLEEQRLEFWINVLIFSSRFFSLLLGCWTGSPRAALGFFAASGVVVYGYYCFSILSKAGVPILNAAKILLEHTLIASPAVLFVFVVRILSWSPLAVVSTATGLLVAYCVVLTVRDDDLQQMLAGILHLRSKEYDRFNSALRNNLPSSPPQP